MKTVRTACTPALMQLEAPGEIGFAFVGGSGWYGAQCSCGWFASGRSLGALEVALQDHQVPAYCPAFAAFRAQEAEAE